MDHALPRRTAVLLFAVVVVSWGLNWAVTKIIVHSVFPLWATAIRRGRFAPASAISGNFRMIFGRAACAAPRAVPQGAKTCPSIRRRCDRHCCGTWWSIAASGPRRGN